MEKLSQANPDNAESVSVYSDDLRKGQSFCRAAFQSLHISIGGVAKPCCEFEGNIGDAKTNSIDEIWNSAALSDLRTKMLRDERDAGCRKCYNLEDAGANSLRHTFNGSEPISATSDFTANVRPTHLDIRFSNLCNLSCRSCGPDASTKWYADAKKLTQWKLGPSALVETFASKTAALESLGPTLETVERIYFAGGEPLLHEGHYAILQDLIARDRTDVALAYNSNVTELRLGKLEIIPLWSRFKRIRLLASIDGHEERGELIRQGLSWGKFVENIRTVGRECPHVEISFAITVSIFNILTLPELCRSLMEIDTTRRARFHFNILQDPEHYSAQILPTDMKLEAKQKIESFALEFGLSKDVAPVINFMMFEDRSEKLSSFRRNSFRLDDLRRQSTADTIPELAPLLRENTLQRHARKAIQSVDGLIASLRRN